MLRVVSFVLFVTAATWLRCAQGAEPSLADLIERVEPSVVRINTDTGLGSGVIVDSSGVVATNFHVIEGAREAKITLKDGKSFAVIGAIATLPQRDIALLKFEPGGHKLKACIIADAVPRKGERVVAFGAPLGFSWTASEGIVSAKREGSEIFEAMAGLYEALGYDRKAKWIQTTAAISPGNSGGPLVSMAGEVVGLNTWHRPEAQNLNFAIDCTELRHAMVNTSSNPMLLAKIASRKPRHSPRSIRSPANGEHSVLELPSGNVLDETVFREDVDALVRGLNQDQATSTLRHPNGSLYAIAKHQNGVLHGPVIAFYQSSLPMTFVTYVEGKRHGNLKTWNAKGEKVLFGQYVRGKPHGFCCTFENDLLTTVLEYERGQLKHMHLVSGDVVTKSIEGDQAARKDSMAKQWLEKIDKLELKLRRSEREFKKLVTEDDRRVRQQRVSVLNPEKRARGQARINAHAADREQAIRAIRARAGL